MSKFYHEIQQLRVLLQFGPQHCATEKQNVKYTIDEYDLCLCFSFIRLDFAVHEVTTVKPLYSGHAL